MLSTDRDISGVIALPERFDELADLTEWLSMDYPNEEFVAMDLV